MASARDGSITDWARATTAYKIWIAKGGEEDESTVESEAGELLEAETNWSIFAIRKGLESRGG